MNAFLEVDQPSTTHLKEIDFGKRILILCLRCPVETIAERLLPVLPLRDIVVFPHMIVPLFVGREKSVNALEEVMAENKQILLLTQRDAATEDPEQADMYSMGTARQYSAIIEIARWYSQSVGRGDRRAQVEIPRKCR